MDTFNSLEFGNRAFKSFPDVLNTEFLDKCNNFVCIYSVCYSRLVTPFEWAVYNSYLDIIKYLVENGADITMRNNFGIRWIAHKGYIDIVKYLLSTCIYSEEDIHRYATNFPQFKELLINYKQFPRTKACR